MQPMRMYGLRSTGRGKMESHLNCSLLRRPARGNDGNIGGFGDLGV
jgi:hypothetical protein